MHFEAFSKFQLQVIKVTIKVPSFNFIYTQCDHTLREVARKSGVQINYLLLHHRLSLFVLSCYVFLIKIKMIQILWKVRQMSVLRATIQVARMV